MARTYEIERSSLADQVYHHIKNMILSAELEGGQKIPEETIAQRFGISRTPVREALKRLEQYGLVRIKRRTYAEVAVLHPDEAEAVSEVRAALEVVSAVTLSRKGNSEDFDTIEKLSKECNEALEKGELARTFEKDSELHLEIARRTGNAHLLYLMELIDAKVQLLRLVLHLPKDKLHHFVHQHIALVEAMRARDAKKVEEVMRAHILGQLDHFQPKET